MNAATQITELPRPARPPAKRWIADVGVAQLNKHGEELCGDQVEVVRTGASTIVVLSDGLGSGVKANILARLTTRMAATMLAGGADVAATVSTIVDTLPICQVRKIAYSTLTVCRVAADGECILTEMENPEAFYLRGGVLTPIDREPLQVGQKEIQEAHFRLSENDVLALVTDGVVHAGIGGIWNLGWRWDRVGQYLEFSARSHTSAQDIANDLMSQCDRLYDKRPGDDATVVVVRCRPYKHVTILAGPPIDKADDDKVTAMLLSAPGVKIVCGGTTGNLVARKLGKEIDVNLDEIPGPVPPTGRLEGLDLATEGMLTLAAALNHLRGKPDMHRLRFAMDGGSKLAKALLEADDVHLIIGRAINPGHQSPGVPAALALKHSIAGEIIARLKELGKTVEIDYF